MTSIANLAAAVLNPQVLSLFAALALLSFLARRSAARALKSSPAKAFWALTSLAAVVSVTLLGRHFEGLAPSFWLTDRTLWHGVFNSQQSNFVLNLVLFVPAGVAIALVLRRPILALTSLSVLSFAIECLQQVSGFGAPDPADWVANSIGATVGVLLALLALTRPKN